MVGQRTSWWKDMKQGGEHLGVTRSRDKEEGPKPRNIFHGKQPAAMNYTDSQESMQFCQWTNPLKKSMPSLAVHLWPIPPVVTLAFHMWSFQGDMSSPNHNRGLSCEVLLTEKVTKLYCRWPTMNLMFPSIDKECYGIVFLIVIAIKGKRLLWEKRYHNNA